MRVNSERKNLVKWRWIKFVLSEFKKFNEYSYLIKNFPFLILTVILEKIILILSIVTANPNFDFCGSL